MSRNSVGCATFALLVLSGALRAAGPSSQFFEAKGVRLHYLTQGRGEAVVLLHGLFMDAESNWVSNGIFGELAKDHRVVALDFPGFGQSEHPAAADAYGRALVEDVVLLLDRLKIRKAHIVGYSVGGLVALKLMAMYPDRVLSGTVCAMGWLQPGSTSQKFSGDVPVRSLGSFPMVFLRGIGELSLTADQLKKIAVPVELIVGDLDPVRWLYVAPLRQLRPDWPVVLVRDAGHIDCVRKPQFRDAIAAWVRKNR